PMMGESGTRGTSGGGQGDGQGGIAEILAHISDGLVGLDGAWRVTYMNTAAERMWRCARDAVAGIPIFETLITDPADPLRIACVDSKARGDPLAVAAHVERCQTWLVVRGYPHPGGYTLLMRDAGEERSAYLATLDATRAQAS